MDPTVERLSMDWIRRAAEYRTLVGKRDQLGCPLGRLDRARLDELERFFLDCADDERPAWATREQIRARISLIVTYSTPAGSLAGDARDLSADGMFIETVSPLPVGAHTIIRVIDRTSADEWRFGAEVVRVAPGPQGGMGLRFVGIPLELRLGHRQPPRTPELQRAA
jgi:hypothetical protein